jgi:hypothetical protein
VKDARNQQILKGRSRLSCSPRSDEGSIQALLVPLRRVQPNAGKKAVARFVLFSLSFS